MADTQKFFGIKPSVGNLAGYEWGYNCADCADSEHIANLRRGEFPVAAKKWP
jgi:hypothetical protein